MAVRLTQIRPSLEALNGYKLTDGRVSTSLSVGGIDGVPQTLPTGDDVLRVALPAWGLSAEVQTFFRNIIEHNGRQALYSFSSEETTCSYYSIGERWRTRVIELKDLRGTSLGRFEVDPEITRIPIEEPSLLETIAIFLRDLVVTIFNAIRSWFCCIPIYTETT